MDTSKQKLSARGAFRWAIGFVLVAALVFTLAPTGALASSDVKQAPAFASVPSNPEQSPASALASADAEKTITITLVPRIKGAKNFKMKAVYGKKYPEDWSHLVRLGYLFTGWHLGSKDGKVVKLTGKCTFKKNVKLFATWKKASANKIAQDIAKRAKKKKGALNRITEASKLVYAYTTLCKYAYNYQSTYNKPEGVFVNGVYTCAGSTRALGLVLTKMGYKWKHVNENKYTHQWNTLKINGKAIWADAMIGMAGYGKHPYV